MTLPTLSLLVALFVTVTKANLLCYTCPLVKESSGCDFEEVRLTDCILPEGQIDAWPRCGFMQAPDPAVLQNIFSAAVEAALNNTQASRTEIDKCTASISQEMSLTLRLELPKKDRYICTESKSCGKSVVADHILDTVFKQCNPTFFYDSFNELAKLDTKIASSCCNQDKCNNPDAFSTGDAMGSAPFTKFKINNSLVIFFLLVIFTLI